MNTLITIEPLYNEVINLLSGSIAERSRRVYLQTYRSWYEWCVLEDVNPLDLYAPNVQRYFTDKSNLTTATKKRQLSAIRKLATALTIADYANPIHRRNLESLSMVKPEGNTDNERGRKILDRAELRRVLAVWTTNTLEGVRNRAMLYTLFYTGMRRMELNDMQWKHVSFDDATIFIPHGKGKKQRYAAIMSEAALTALWDWRERARDFAYVWPALWNYDKPDKQAMMVYRIIEQTGVLAGVDFKPHDARRTFITMMLNSGVPIHEVQAQVGHARGDTTLAYAGATDASERRAKYLLD